MVSAAGTLSDHFETNFAMIRHHKFSLSEIEDMQPWEKDVYMALIKKAIQEEAKNNN